MWTTFINSTLKVYEVERIPVTSGSLKTNTTGRKEHILGAHTNIIFVVMLDFALSCYLA